MSQVQEVYRSSLESFATTAFERLIMEGLIGYGAVRIKADNVIDISAELAPTTICLDLWMEVVPARYKWTITEVADELRKQWEKTFAPSPTMLKLFVATLRERIWQRVGPVP